MKLEGKIAMITGGSRGIGRETAVTFADAGAKVVVADLSEKEGEETVNLISESGGQAFFAEMDVTNREQVEQVVSKVENKWKKIDILINNAGITRDAKALNMTEAEWDQVVETNLKGVFNCTQAVAPGMVEREYGRIVNSGSVVALYGNYGQTNYVASKAGVIGMTKVWAREFGPKGVTVNAVAPGFIETEMTANVPDKIIERISDRTPLGRLGKPAEVAQTFLFLASDDASFINGSVITVDGGLVV